MWHRFSSTSTISRSYKGFRRSFTTPICGTVNRDRYSASLRFVRLAVFRSVFFRALKTRTQCGNARSREVCTSLAHFCAPTACFHLRRHSAARSQSSKICGRCCRTASVVSNVNPLIREWFILVSQERKALPDVRKYLNGLICKSLKI